MSKSRQAIEHIWAHNKDPKASGQRGNKSFHGMAAFSWYTVVAVKYPDKKTVVIAGEGIRNSGYTLKHKHSYINAFSSKWNIIMVDLPPNGGQLSLGRELMTLDGLRKCHDWMRKELTTMAVGVTKATSYSSRATKWRTFMEYLSKVNILGTFLGRKSWDEERFGLDYDAEEENLARWNEVVEQRRRVAQSVRDEKMAEWKKKHEETPEKVEAWRRREHATTWGWNKIYLRLSKDKTHVETSKGASTPVDDSLYLFKFCRIVKARGEGVDIPARATFSVGMYHLDHVFPNGDCKVGCHTISYEEMEKLATEYEASKQ